MKMLLMFLASAFCLLLRFTLVMKDTIWFMTLLIQSILLLRTYFRIMVQGHRDPLNGRVDLSIEDLPENIMFDILSRLPVKTIFHCNCVCKKWRNLVLDSYFVELHLSRSLEGLLIDQYSFIDPGRLGNLMWVEIDHPHLLHDPLLIVDHNDDELHQKRHMEPVASVNGLILFWSYGPDKTYICNPITKEYMILPQQQYYAESLFEVVYGFGVTSSREYKVVRIFQSETLSTPIEIEVYTLGTDQWRSLGQVPYNLSGDENHGLFYDGHIHWIITNEHYTFDLENETFQLYDLLPSISPLDEYEEREICHRHRYLGVVKGFLSLFCYSYHGYTLWVMKEHGNNKSWHKELVIKESIIYLKSIRWYPLCLIDGLNGTTILLIHDSHKEIDKVVAYCLESNTVEDTIISYCYTTAMTYRPSFLKLPTTSSKTS